MSKLYALAGRPANGKSSFINIVQSNSKQNFKVINALDFASHEELVKELYNLVQDDNCKCIAIDDYEVQLINWCEGQVIDDEYKRCLSILAGFSDNFDVAVVVVIGLKRDADRNDKYYFDRVNIRSSSVSEEADEIFFIKQGKLDELSLLTISQLTGVKCN